MSMVLLLFGGMAAAIGLIIFAAMAGRGSSDVASRIKLVYCYLVLGGSIIMALIGVIVAVTALTNLLVPEVHPYNVVVNNFNRNITMLITACTAIACAVALHVTHRRMLK